VLQGSPVSKDAAVKMIPVDTTFQSFVAVSTADLTTDAALAAREGLAHGERPWLLFVHYIDPHADYFPPAEFANRFGVRPGAPLTGADQRPVLSRMQAPAAPEDLATLIGLYDGEIAFTDVHIGRLLDQVERQQRETLVIVTADHG